MLETVPLLPYFSGFCILKKKERLLGMSFLNETILRIPVSDWLPALGVAAAAYCVMLAARGMIVHHFGKLAAKSATTLDDAVVDMVRHTHQLFLLAMSLLIGAQTLELPKKVEAVLDDITAVALLIQAALWISSFLTFAINAYVGKDDQADGAARTTKLALGFLSRIVLWTLALLLVLSNLGFNITALITGLGIGGVAVALALQNILGDLFASFSILIDKPFVVGDFVVVDTFQGTVEHIGLKTTRVRSLSGEQLIISNADLTKGRIRNFKRMQERRILFQFSIVYETLPENLARIPDDVKQIIAGIEKTRFDRAHLLSLGPLALVYEVVYFVLDPDYNVYMDIHHRINLEIIRRLAEMDVKFSSTIFTQRPELAAPQVSPPV